MSFDPRPPSVGNEVLKNPWFRSIGYHIDSMLPKIQTEIDFNWKEENQNWKSWFHHHSSFVWFSPEIKAPDGDKVAQKSVCSGYKRYFFKYIIVDLCKLTESGKWRSAHGFQYFRLVQSTSNYLPVNLSSLVETFFHI